MGYATGMIHEMIGWAGDRKKLARKVGVSVKTVYAWSIGRNRPSIQAAIRIQKVSQGRFLARDVRPDLKDWL